VDKDVCALTFSDDGVGIPAGLDIAKAKTLGLQLVHMLALQLTGNVNVERAPGTRFEIRFPIWICHFDLEFYGREVFSLCRLIVFRKSIAYGDGPLKKHHRHYVLLSTPF
jgi:hypothetical protein